jgi:hypothetical protein
MNDDDESFFESYFIDEYDAFTAVLENYVKRCSALCVTVSVGAKVTGLSGG